MPELPEVETIVRALKVGGGGVPPITGRMITVAQVLWDKTLAEPSVAEFATRLTGQKILDVRRRGKFILLQLESDTFILHLRMSGDVRIEPIFKAGSAQLPLLKHDRLVLTFENGWRLVFNDPRKFGRAWLVREPDKILAGLGVEPLDDQFSAEDLKKLLVGRKRAIKPLLLDQSVISGLGNIYTDEALHLAGIHPLTLANALSSVDYEHLWLAIRNVLHEGIRHNGASIDWVYRGGDFQNYFRVYGRQGQPCPVCQTPVQKIIVGQRGTHFCPTCQPLLKGS